MRSRVTPSIVIAVSALVTASIIAGELVLLAKYDRVAATFGLPQLSTATMPDGTTLILHSVSSGSVHSMQVPLFQQSLNPGGRPASLQTLNYPTGRDVVVFLVSRHATESHEFLDVDWWSYCLIEDAHGNEIASLGSQRSVYSLTASNSERSDQRHPFKPLNAQLANAADKRVILAIEFPAFRSASASTLQFFNQANEKVASLAFVPSWQPPATEWTPQPLPATVNHGEVSLVLKDARLRAHKRTSQDSKPGPRWQLECDAELLQDSQPAQHWPHGLQNVSDVLGNDVSPWDMTLSRKEPAWRVRFQARRQAGAEFSDNERLTLRGVRILEVNTFDIGLASLRGDTPGLIAVAAAGVGHQEFSVPYSIDRNGMYSSSGSVPIANGNAKHSRFSLRWRDAGRGEQEQQLTLSTDAPCLILRNDGLPEGTEILVRITDLQGREIPSHIRSFYDFAWLLFFDASPGIGELTCELFVQRPLEFEFLISPPQPPTAN